MPPKVNRRQWPRHKKKYLVQIVPSLQSGQTPVWVTNFSRGGLCFVSHEALERGAGVMVHLTLEMAGLAREGRGVVVALHDVNLALRYASRMAFLREGRLMGIIPPAEVDGRILESVFDVRWGIAEEAFGFRLVFPV